MKAAPVFEAGNHRWWVLYDQDERRVIDSNVYVVESNGQSAILDPGGFEIFPQVLSAVAEVVPPTSVTKAFVSHQDPDIASSLPCGTHAIGRCSGIYPACGKVLSGTMERWTPSLSALPMRAEPWLSAATSWILSRRTICTRRQTSMSMMRRRRSSSVAMWEQPSCRPVTVSGWADTRAGNRREHLMSIFSMRSSFISDGCLLTPQKRTGSTVFASWTSIIFVLSTERFTQVKTWNVS